MEKEASARFLDAFAGLETYLRTRYGSGTRHEEFSVLLSRAERSDRGVRPHLGELRLYADMRNLLAHHRMQGRWPFAVDEGIVQHLEQIVRTLTRTKDVYSIFKGAVTTTTVDTPIGQALMDMSRLSLSQLPVQHNQVVVNMLTADTIARWLGGNVHDELADLTVPVQDVLRHKEDHEKYDFIPRNESLINVLAAFDSHTRHRERLSALLITQHGRAGESLLGIVTAYDLPRALEAAEE